MGGPWWFGAPKQQLSSQLGHQLQSILYILFEFYIWIFDQSLVLVKSIYKFKAAGYKSILFGGIRVKRCIHRIPTF